MPESHESPSVHEKAKQMSAAIEAVVAAQSLLRARRALEPFQTRFPETSDQIIRATVRSLESNEETRRAIYQLFGCAPEERN